MIKIEHLSKTYDRHTKNRNKVLSDISFTLPDTGFICVLGESGCGKTSLLNAIGGLDRFDSGAVVSGDTRMTRYGSHAMELERNRSFGYIFQNYHLLQDHSVMYNIYVGMHSLGLTHKEKIARSKEVLRNVGMEHYPRRIVGSLSGGQQQRVAIARALARRPRVIFADEPTGNLDEANTVNICTLLRGISAKSLVVMVTHEERIARFFADRIIRIGEGKIQSDISSWDRNALSFDSAQRVYAGELNDTSSSSERVTLRVLCEEGADPVDMTVIARGDSIIIKVNDGRKLTCVKNNDLPEIIEGKRPEITLESAEKASGPSVPDADKDVEIRRAGAGFTPAMVFREGRHVIRRRGSKSFITRIFLVLLSALAVFTAGDFLTISHIDPHDFITTDSHILNITVSRGEELDPNDDYALTKAAAGFRDFVSASGLDFEFLPSASVYPIYTEKVFRQMNGATVMISDLSYLPVSRLDPETLIYGRMPENSSEFVVDRWVLDKLLGKSGVVQNGISDISYFIGKTLQYSQSKYKPVIVGICDNGSPAIYLNRCGMIAVVDRSSPVITIDEFTEYEPDKLEITSLEEGTCAVIEVNAGAIWGKRIGRDFTVGSAVGLEIVASYPYSVDTFASAVINENDIDTVYNSLLLTRFDIYCADKAAMLSYIDGEMPEDMKANINVKVKDNVGDKWAEQQALARERVQSRVIVTVSVMAVSLIMLWLLQRSRVRGCADMAIVYRMLCIPKRKLVSVFITSAFLDSLTAALPATAITFAAMKIASSLPSLGYGVYLPWYVAAAVFAAILVYHTVSSVVPLMSMLRVPPASLSAKFEL